MVIWYKNVLLSRKVYPFVYPISLGYPATLGMFLNVSMGSVFGSSIHGLRVIMTFPL